MALALRSAGQDCGMCKHNLLAALIDIDRPGQLQRRHQIVTSNLLTGMHLFDDSAGM